jgi:hypothetical protein
VNCKKDDMAFIRATHPRKDLHGLVVTVHEFMGNQDGYIDVWRFTFASGQSIPDDTGEPQTWGYIQDAYLVPISGVPVDEDVRDEVTA